ncbi:MAG: hypothetical protein JWN14_4088, partial [Chthonomonadales bacterium]|nr:hypothetical protein [Chthonomonadales bacterium]
MPMMETIGQEESYQKAAAFQGSAYQDEKGNGAQTPYSGRCVHELFEAQVERTPEAPAV